VADFAATMRAFAKRFFEPEELDILFCQLEEVRGRGI